MVIQRVVDFAKRSGKKTEGFTLVELLIVVAIIAILAAIAIPQFSQYRLRAYVTALQSDAKNSYTAAQAYLTDFPATAAVDADMLRTGGYNPSTGITMEGLSTLNISAGSFRLVTDQGALDNANTTIFFNGRIAAPAMP